VYDSATVGSDQVNTASAAAQTLAFGTAPPSGNSTDGPIPPWTYGLLGISMWFIARQRLARPGTRVRR
jgi:hypothetical protein